MGKKKKLYKARKLIIEEIDKHERIKNHEGIRDLVKNYKDFSYGYNVGLSQAAMILLDLIDKKRDKQHEEYD